MTFSGSSSSFMADKSESPSITPKKLSSRSKFYKQHQHATPKPTPTPTPTQSEHKENDGCEKARRFSFSHRPAAAAGKSFLSPKCIKSFASAVRSPLTRFSPKKILGDKSNACSKEHVEDDETVLKEEDLVRRLSSFTADEDLAGTYLKEEAEEIKHAVCPVADEPIPRAHWQQIVDKEQMSSPDERQQHLDDSPYGKGSLKEMILLEEQETLSCVTEDYALNSHPSDKYRLEQITFVEYLDSDGHGLDSLPTHGRAGLKHGDDLYSGCTFAFTESFGSNMIHPRDELVESEKERSSKSLVATEAESDTTTKKSIFAGLFKARDDYHPRSTGSSRLFPAKMFALSLCFAAVFCLGCRKPQLLSSLAQQSQLPWLWMQNNYGEEMKILVKGTEGLWIHSQLAGSTYPEFQVHQLQRKVKIAITAMRKNLKFVEITSKFMRAPRFANKKVIQFLHGKIPKKEIEQLRRYSSSLICKILHISSDMFQFSSYTFQKLSEHWKNQMPIVQHLRTISGIRNSLVKARNFLMGMVQMTTRLNMAYNSLKNRLVAITTPLKEVSKSIENKLVQRFKAQDFHVILKKWERGLAYCLSSSSAMQNSLLTMLHSNYEVALKHISVRFANAEKPVFIEAVARTPAEERNEDMQSPAVKEWNLFSEYDIPLNEYLESPDAMVGSNYSSQLDELMSALVHGESKEIKARFSRDLLQAMESDEDADAVEDDGGVARANDDCHSNTRDQELLSSKCTENLTTSQCTEISDDQMHICVKNVEVDAAGIKEEPDGDDHHISQLARFDQAAGANSDNSKDHPFLVKDLNSPSLVSFQFEHSKLSASQEFKASEFSNDIFYMLTILVTFTSLAYYLYFHHTSPKKNEDSWEKKDGSPKCKELKMQPPKPKKMETRRINASNRIKNRSK